MTLGAEPEQRSDGVWVVALRCGVPGLTVTEYALNPDTARQLSSILARAADAVDAQSREGLVVAPGSAIADLDRLRRANEHGPRIIGG